MSPRGAFDRRQLPPIIADRQAGTDQLGAPRHRTALLYGPGLSGRATARGRRGISIVCSLAAAAARLSRRPATPSAAAATDEILLFTVAPRHWRCAVTVRGAPLSRASRQRGAARAKTGQLMIIWRTATAPQVFTPVLACFCARCESSRD